MTQSASARGLEFENQVRQSLKRIGFNDIDGGPGFTIGGHQVDACAGWDDVLLIIECTQTERDDATIRDLISEVRGKRSAIQRGFRDRQDFAAYRRFEFAIVTKNIDLSNWGDLAAQKPPIHLIDFQALQYYQRLSGVLGQETALFNFLGELQVAPADIKVPKMPAFRVRFGKHYTGYLFWCVPNDLLKIAYVARRESGHQMYYQRMIEGRRLERIAEDYINQGRIFPNNIIISFDQRPQFREKPAYEDSWPSGLDFGELTFPKSYRSAWIIDGQHRLYAFSKASPNPGLQKVAVFAFDPMKTSEQANFFISINGKQKPVSKDLLWDLEGEMSKETHRGRIANCVKKLNTLPPLKDKIFVPLSGERKRGQLKISGLCEDLQEVRLLNDRTHAMTQGETNPLAYRTNLDALPDRVASALSTFLTTLNNTCPSWLWDNILLRPGGLFVVFHVYEQVLIKLRRMPTETEINAYTNRFAEALQELVPSQSAVRSAVRERFTSYAQRRQTVWEICSLMQILLDDRDFGTQERPTKVEESLESRFRKFERSMAEAICGRLEIGDSQTLRQKTPEAVAEAVVRRWTKEQQSRPETQLHTMLTLGELHPILERRDNGRILMPLFSDSEIGFGDSEAVLVALKAVTTARNNLIHGRPLGNRRLVTAYLTTFERLLGL